MKESRPEFTISAASINSEPVELDGTPTSPERLRRGSRATASEEMSLEDRKVSLHHDHTHGRSLTRTKKRAQLHKERKDDPAVLVDIPQTPQAEELEKSGATTSEAEATASSNPSVSIV